MWTRIQSHSQVYSWDIVAHRVGDKLFLDKRDTGGISNPVDALTVSETSGDPPSFEGAGINNAKVITRRFVIKLFHEAQRCVKI